MEVHNDSLKKIISILEKALTAIQNGIFWLIRRSLVFYNTLGVVYLITLYIIGQLLLSSASVEP